MTKTATELNTPAPLPADDYETLFRQLSDTMPEQQAIIDALRQSQAQLHCLLARSPSVIYTCDANNDFKPTFVSENMPAILGYETTACLTEPQWWISHIHPDDQATALASNHTLLQTGKHSHQYRVRHKLGHYVWIHDEVYLIKDDQGQPEKIIGSWTDITEVKQAQAMIDHKEQELQQHRKQLAQANKFSLVGEMTGNIAHELNQPIAAIANYARGCVWKLRQKGTKKDDIIDGLEAIMLQAERAGDIIHHTRALFQSEEIKRTPTCLHQLINTIIQRIKAENKHFQVHTHFAQPDVCVTVGVIQIEQVLVNIIQNALDANAPHTIDVSVTTQFLREDEVKITVHNTGIPIQTTPIEKIFEPFVSDKPDGLGLGLTIAKTIMAAHDGSIKATSDAHGVAFTMTLPVAAKSA